MKTTDLQLKENYIISGNREKSIYCTMVLRLMDTKEYSNNYYKALCLVVDMFPEIDVQTLEEELDKYI